MWLGNRLLFKERLPSNQILFWFDTLHNIMDTTGFFIINNSQGRMISIPETKSLECAFEYILCLNISFQNTFTIGIIIGYSNKTLCEYLHHSNIFVKR